MHFKKVYLSPYLKRSLAKAFAVASARGGSAFGGKALANKSADKNPTSSENRKFVSYLMAPDKKEQQTFEIILPNLIHKSKKRNLK